MPTLKSVPQPPQSFYTSCASGPTKIATMVGRPRHFVFLFCLVASAATGARSNGPSPLWGDLRPGPYAVGYRTLFAYDAARPPLDGAASPGRQMQINVWYPARRSRGARMRFGDYVALLVRGIDFSPPTSDARGRAVERFIEHPAELGGDPAVLRA